MIVRKLSIRQLMASGMRWQNIQIPEHTQALKGVIPVSVLTINTPLAPPCGPVKESAHPHIPERESLEAEAAFAIAPFG